MKDNRICVFAGSGTGSSSGYTGAAATLGSELARRGIAMIFGGGATGLMGAAADAALARGGEVIGVVPEFLVSRGREMIHNRLTELHVVESMHERKALMFELSAGFIALPGGLGTLEEILEMLTWRQLGLHEKPCAVLNVNGYFEPLLNLLDYAVAKQFLQSGHRNRLIVETTPETVLDSIETQNISADNVTLENM